MFINVTVPGRPQAAGGPNKVGQHQQRLEASVLDYSGISNIDVKYTLHSICLYFAILNDSTFELNEFHFFWHIRIWMQPIVIMQISKQSLASNMSQFPSNTIKRITGFSFNLGSVDTVCEG